MPCEILIAAVGKPEVTDKGYPWIIKDCPCVWGRMECPPNWVILHLTNATKANVEHLLASWYKSFAYEILGENEQGYRIKVTVDPDFVSASGANKELRADLKDDLVTNWGASIVSYNGFEAVVDIPKPVSLLELQAHIYDIFSERVDTRMYYFSEADVDLALSKGGYIEMTKEQALERILCKLDE